MSPAVIAIAAHEENGFLVLSVSDNGRPKAEPTSHGTGVGLKNVRERLAQRFDENYALTAGPTESGFTCTIKLPLRMLLA